MTTTYTIPNRHPGPWGYFKASTPDHELTVLHDDGLYRHLHMGAPGTGVWSWSIVTWPGYLAISGDIGAGFIFSRDRDMVEFFAGSRGTCEDGSPAINPGYWAEKLQEACRGSAKKFSEKKFMAAVRSTVAEHIEDHALVGEELADAEALIEEADEVSGWQETAFDWAYNYPGDLFGSDFIEGGFEDFDWHFLYACYAIAITVRAYRSKGD